MADIVPFRRIADRRQKAWDSPAFLKPRRALRFPVGVFHYYAALVVLIVIAFATIYFISTSAPRTATITAPATVVDGDTLRVGSNRIRLVGVDAPEMMQTCRDSSGRSYFCGRTARERLVALVSGSPVTCASQGLDRYGRTLAICASSRSADLGETLVREGHAVSYRGGYRFTELGARFGGRGLWRGDFERPSDWRRAHRQ